MALLVRGLRIAALVALAAAVLAPARLLAANIVIVNVDGGGEGFNDGTPASPVGGNPGTTIGAQRLYVFQYAADIWGHLLPSNVQIRVRAKFDPQTCDASSGVLGSAGPATTWRDFSGAPLPGHWYHVALANKLAGSDLDAGDDINATFNSSIGQATCLPEGWYYGVDGNEGTKIELLPVVLHELGHGLGFSTTTSASNGFTQGGYPSIYDHFLLDNSIGLHWEDMTAAQRVSSATACTHLVWDGPWVTQKAPDFLGDRPIVRVNSPAGIAGDRDVGVAGFGPALSSPGVTGTVVLANDGVGTTSNACEALVNAGAINGKVALVDRGGCPFATKVKNAQNAGAIAVIVADSVAGCPPGGIGGVDPTITIPSVRITQADGQTIKANLGSNPNVTLRRDPSRIAGADAAGHVYVYTPSAFAGGSTVSHFDVSADPDLLMEPALNTALSRDVDLTWWHFADIGWFDPNLLAAPEPPRVLARVLGNEPNPFEGGTTIRFALATGAQVELGIYDLSGRLVRRLSQDHLGQGMHAIGWNGLDADGRRAAPGVYLYRLSANGLGVTRRMVMVR